MDIVDRLHDLIRQATTDHTHYYVKSVCEEALIEIENLRGRVNHERSADNT